MDFAKRRWRWMWCFLLLGFCSLGVQAQAFHLQVLQNVPASVGIDQVAKRPASDFAALDPDTNYPLGYHTSLWLRIDLAQVTEPTGDHGPWVIEFRQPFLDRVDLYSQDAQGVWTVRSAGDWIANAQWPLPGPSPVLKLPSSQTSNRVLYAKVSSMIPMRINPSFRSLDDAKKSSQDSLLLACLLMGCIALMTVLGAALAFTYRNRVYAWYAAYTVMSLFAVGSYCGVTSYALWTNSPLWADISLMVFIKGACISQLVFCALLFKPALSQPRAASAIAKIGMGLLVLLPFYAYFMLPHEGWPLEHFGARMIYSFVLIVACFVVSTVLAVLAVRKMRKLASLYLLAYVPLLVTTVLALLSHLGYVPMPWLPFNAPLYALVLEIGIQQMVLQLHAKEHFSAMLVRRTLDATDPLTGFVASHAFKSVASTAWNEAIEQKTDIAIAYLEADDGIGNYKAGFGMDDEERKLRIVRTLRAGTRSLDIVAVRNENTFAIIMPGIAYEDDLPERLARIVALGMMVEAKVTGNKPIRFRIAASTLNGFTGKLAELDT